MIRLAVLGSPIKHSLSPVIHNAAYRYLGVPAQYEKFDVTEDGFKAFISEHQADKWRGFSLTMPLKEIGLEVAKDVDSRALQAGAINTLVSDGANWRGVNTDVSGFMGLFQSVKFDRVSILGAGGTSRAALVALSAFPVKIRVFRRNKMRDAGLLTANRNIEIVDWEGLTSSIESDLLINCTPSGSLDEISLHFGQIQAAIDSLYSPWPPPLTQLVSAKTFFSGKDLLVSQALEQISLFADMQFDRDEMFERLRSLI